MRAGTQKPFNGPWYIIPENRDSQEEFVIAVLRDWAILLSARFRITLSDSYAFQAYRRCVLQDPANFTEKYSA